MQKKMKIIEEIKNYNSFQSRYSRLKESENNKKARKHYRKMIDSTYADQELSEQEEAVLFSQAYQRLLLKNPSSAEFGAFDEYEIEKTDTSYIVKGACDSTNSYGAKMREKYTLEVCKIDGQWTCVTDVGMRYLIWIGLGLLAIILPTIIASCSLSSLY